MAQAAHIRIAQTDGAKAGFNAYLEMLKRSGLPTVAATLREIEQKGNKKAQFDFYCSKFGSKFGNAQVDNSLDDVDDTPTIDPEVGDLLAQLDALKARIAGLTDAAPAQRTTRSSGASQGNTSTNKPATFKAGAIRVKQIPTQVGATFTYKGKTRNTKMRVIAVSGSGANQVVTAERV